MSIIIDLFAGAGGFSVGAHRARPDDWIMGVEWDENAYATHVEAGMNCVQADLKKLPVDTWGRPDHLHASPPCQSFSNAGKGHGRQHLDTLAHAVRQILYRGEHTVDLTDIDDNTQMVLTPAYWIHAHKPDTISFEQVRGVLPLWEVYAEALRFHGYDTWAGLIHSEQFGLPQTRTRAWMLASLHGSAQPPAPTHSRYHVRTPDRLDDGVLPWVSMSEALNLNGIVGFPRKADTDDIITIDGEDYRARDFRDSDQPAFNLTEKARSWTHIMQGGVSGEGRPRTVDAPAPTIGAKATASVTDDPTLHYGKERKAANETGEDWTHYRQSARSRSTTRRVDQPAPTIQFGNDAANAHLTNNPDDIGYKRVSHGDDEQPTERRVRRITVTEAAILQGFPAGHPWQGKQTSTFRQIGNAVPPPVAEAVVRTLMG